MLKLILRFNQTTLKRANLHTTFYLAFVEFLQIWEFTYNKVEKDFRFWNLTRGLVSFLENRNFFVVPSCKTDSFRWGITLTISAASYKASIVKSYNHLFTLFLKVGNHALFTRNNGTFSYNYAIEKLQEEISAFFYKENYISHSFKKAVTTSTRLTGLSEDEMQLLERWKSNSYRLYVKTSLN